MSGSLNLELPKPRGRTSVSASTADDFTAGAKRRKDPGERVHVILPPDLAMKLRLAAVRQRRSVSDAATEAITAWLSQE